MKGLEWIPIEIIFPGKHNKNLGKNCTILIRIHCRIIKLKIVKIL